MTHLKLQKLQKGDITQQHIDILGDVLVGNHLFCIFCSFRCVIRRKLVSKLQFFYIYL